MECMLLAKDASSRDKSCTAIISEQSRTGAPIQEMHNIARRVEIHVILRFSEILLI